MHLRLVVAVATFLPCVTSASPMASELNATHLVTNGEAAPRLRGRTTNEDTENRSFFWTTTTEKLRRTLKDRMTIVGKLNKKPDQFSKYSKALKRGDSKIEKLYQKHKRELDKLQKIIQDKRTMKENLSVTLRDPKIDRVLRLKTAAAEDKLTEEISRLMNRKADMEAGLA
ncbi:uncharacterized protein CCR75_003269 [Bremia lactucae]|uniref:RxLR effector protein n=1 Tax=Bremia lactucae TaxID=4779 RepID=A0A976NY44_BRELC|nr:hypothetical protein CCR75_003269 [Bremia lactucae]